MLRSIVVPLDGTPFSEQAIPLSATIASRASAGLEFVHVHVHDGFDDELSALTPYRLEGVEREAQRREMNERNQELRYLGEQALRVQDQYGAPVEPIVIDGRISDALIAHIRQRDPDLIVMTTHARAGLERFRFGSVADDLLHRLNVPLLLLRGKPEAQIPTDRAFGQIVIALDGSWLAEDVVEAALDLAEVSAARITLLTAKVPGEPHAHPKYLTSLAAEIRRQGLGVDFVIFQCEDVAQGIAQYAEMHGADLIAMATHGRGGLSRLVAGSVADTVLHLTSTPMLLVRPQPRT